MSSLDINHIFGVYSLIKSKIVVPESYLQLFISTHNLEFLKYLKSLKGKKYMANPRTHYIILNQCGVSEIKLMPKYLKDYMTEFNYLFAQVYKISTMPLSDIDENLMYNFGNNTRKFLESYLYFRYPTNMEISERLDKFFGKDSHDKFLVERVIHEGSHLASSFDRGARPVEQSEVKQVADIIINEIRKDTDQFDALVSSVSDLV